MNAVSMPGVNLAKDTLFSVHGIDGEGAATVRSLVLRNRLAELVAQLPPCLRTVASGPRFQSCDLYLRSRPTNVDG